MVVLSWAVALVAWPLAWLLLAVAQGVGTMIAGGGWIGVAVPMGLHPWGLVNEPSIAFADTRAALVLYWLAPPLAALAVAVLLPTVVPVPHSWVSELGMVQLAAASAVLGLGWAPPLGVADGPASGVDVFWGVSPALFIALAAVLGAAVVQLAVARLCGHLWMEPGGPRRGRRVLAAGVHAFPPAVVWVLAVLVQGWAVQPLALLTAAAVLVGTLIGGWAWMPGSPLHPYPQVRWRTVALAGVAGVAVLALASWAGAPARGHGTALVWGLPGQTNNVRPGMAVVRVTPLRGLKRPPAR